LPQLLPSQSQPLLVPKGQTGQASRRLRERTKLPRLNGADLYVARLGREDNIHTNDPVTCCENSSAETEIEAPTRSATGSLHDELQNPQGKPRPVTGATNNMNQKRPSVLSSKPCYRCISYMASVGIKRVFWTTGAGTWESAKVRDLVDELDKLGLEQSPDAATTLGSAFVTKHEVLMLRRTMGEN
jgi:hypothetical protein